MAVKKGFLHLPEIDKLEPRMPGPPGHLATEEGRREYDEMMLRLLVVQKESAKLAEQRRAEKPELERLFHELANAALNGDTRQAQKMLLGMAEDLEMERPIVLHSAVRMFFIEALRRIANNKECSSIVSGANAKAKARAKSERDPEVRPGRPVESHKHLSSALFIARRVKRGSTVKEAMDALVKVPQPWAAKSEASARRAWKLFGEQALKVVRELEDF